MSSNGPARAWRLIITISKVRQICTRKINKGLELVLARFPEMLKTNLFHLKIDFTTKLRQNIPRPNVSQKDQQVYGHFKLVFYCFIVKQQMQKHRLAADDEKSAF